MTMVAGQPHQQLNNQRADAAAASSMHDDKPCVQHSAVAAEAFAVEEPPADEVAAAERQADVARLLAGFRQHLHDRAAHHLGMNLQSCTQVTRTI